MKKLLRSASLCLCAMLTLTSTPLSAVQAAASKGGKEVYVTGFEDGDVSKFSKRGDDDTSVIKASSAEPHSGDYCMEVTERDQGWNGPSIALKDLCEPGVLYVASAWVKAKWYNSCKLSMQYTDSEGVQHYNNLSKATSQGEWVKIPEIRFCLFDSMKDVSLYIECLLDHAANHVLSGVEVGDYTVAQRPHGADALMHLAVHLAGTLTHGDGLVGLGVEGDHRRLVDDDAVVMDDNGVGCS